MDKKALYIVSEILIDDAIPNAKKGEKFEDYLKRGFQSFADFVEKRASENSAIEDYLKTVSRNNLYNAIAMVPVRSAIVGNFCKVNDPVEITEPEEATTADILEHNGLPKDLEKSMDADAFQNLIKKLKTPKSQGLTATERREMIENHHAKYEPAFPSEKEYSHGTGGTTRGWHWEADLQDEYLKDHERFTSKYKLDDRFYSEPEPEKAEESEKKTESESK